MGRIALLPVEAKTEDANRHELVERSMPVNYMGDFSVLGILVDRLSDAIRLLEQNRFDIVSRNRFAEVVTSGPEQVRRLFHLLDDGGIVFGFSDLADGVYQG